MADFLQSNGLRLPGSSVHGILQARILERIAFLLQRIFLTQGSNLGLVMSLALVGRFFTASATWEVKADALTTIAMLIEVFLFINFSFQKAFGLSFTKIS